MGGSMNIVFTREAFEQMSQGQLDAIKYMTRESSGTTKLTIHKAGFDLPDGYLTFSREFGGSSHFYGGISPLGDVST
jgi:hypothetical protein